MSRRTVAEARTVLEQTKPHLSEYWVTRYTSVIERKEQQAREHAEGSVAQRADEALRLRDEALRELTEVRDGLDDLAKEGKAGRTPSRDYLSRMEELKQRQVTAEGQLDRADAIAQDVERIEADPLAWFSELQERSPRLKQEFPW